MDIRVTSAFGDAAIIVYIGSDVEELEGAQRLIQLVQAVVGVSAFTRGESDVEGAFANVNHDEKGVVDRGLERIGPYWKFQGINNCT